MRGLKTKIYKEQLEALRRVPLEKHKNKNKTKEGGRSYRRPTVSREWKSCHVPGENRTACHAVHKASPGPVGGMTRRPILELLKAAPSQHLTKAFPAVSTQCVLTELEV